ncbi:hypothetical protein B0H67DRAFT_646323 [Lasiosphaeris hirsuta]|uniref:Uncharacterized protein n=1 Tax=Lasiosphaeris hirsuta TaxID=260670 RepID=A0AA40DPK3_9PEZI|nr:hypothetical protein B0H67DRAFT_646323 [Lasiosphaeris hirsuta]
MPAQGRLPPVDGTTSPFSNLFDKSGFDLKTVEATAQLADQSIFVTSNGRRYLVSSIPDGAAANAHANAGQAPLTPIAPRMTPPAEPKPNAIQTIGARFRNSFRRRPTSGSNTSSDPRSPGGSLQSPQGAAPASPTSPMSPSSPASPRASVHEVTTMMSHLDVNRFGAAPLYWESDGGVQTAEALTDPNTVPRGPTSPNSPISPTAPLSPQLNQQTMNGAHPSADPNIPPHMAGVSGHIANFDYVNYTAQANYHRQMAVPVASGLPSLMEFASPMPPSRRESEVYSPIDEPYSEKEFLDGQPNNEYATPAHLRVPSYVGTPGNYVINPRTYSSGNDIDTLTPVVVIPTTSHGSHAYSTSSDGASTSRDNVLPGEILLYDGPVKSAQTLTSPFFQDGQLKVFRNTLSNDIRFHCKVGHESETHWMKAINAQLVPVYAYDPRFPNVVYIRDNESEKGNIYLQSSPGSSRPSGIYQFPRLKDLCDFQAKLTTEKVVLDITSVKLVKLNKDSRSSETFYSVRLQMWHEAELRKSSQSDVASFVTAGTALSGPLRDRLVASSSRLIVYLGRLGEYITLFITDDIELKPDGPTMVKLKPRKAGSFSKKGSRWPGIKAHIERKGSFDMAGLDIHGQAMDPDIDSTYDLYKTLEIDFENSPSQDNFIRKWDEVMRERRQQRLRLNQIKEEMGQAVFSGPIAREIW